MKAVSIAEFTKGENVMQFRFALAGLMLAGFATAAMAQAPAAPARPALKPSGITVTSSAFESGAILPDQFSAKNNQPGKPAGSPPLAWRGAPEGTQSFTLVMHDLDVVMNSGTTDNLHWIAWNIPASVTSLPAGVPNTPTLPDGTVQGKNRVGIGFDGPGAPATGPYHHYVFEIYALDTKLALGPDASRAQVMAAMEGHVLDRGTLVARFHR
jgi:Raf kinase inhibitor-like YbhB/YbcL family protein